MTVRCGTREDSQAKRLYLVMLREASDDYAAEMRPARKVFEAARVLAEKKRRDRVAEAKQWLAAQGADQAYRRVPHEQREGSEAQA